MKQDDEPSAIEAGAAEPACLSRRMLLRRAAVLLGASLSAPAVLGVLAGRTAHASTATGGQLLWGPQFALVAEVAEIMIPRTDTPGARDVGVPAFIDDMLANVYPEVDQKRFLTGLMDFDNDVKKRAGRTFLELSPDKREAQVRRVLDDALALEPPDDQRPFILMTRELTLLGYFTSKEGATQVLQYQAVPGAWQACLPVEEAGIGRTWATDKPLPF